MGPTFKIEFLGILGTRVQELPAGFKRINNIVSSQSYDLSKLGSRLYLQFVHKFQLRLETFQACSRDQLGNSY